MKFLVNTHTVDECLSDICTRTSNANFKIECVILSPQLFEKFAKEQANKAQWIDVDLGEVTYRAFAVRNTQEFWVASDPNLAPDEGKVFGKKTAVPSILNLLKKDTKLTEYVP